jgi:hypothetical protein
VAARALLPRLRAPDRRSRVRYALDVTDDSAPDLAGLCADCAAELDDAAGSSDGSVTVYAREGIEFARVRGGILRLRLPVDIAEAALNTPDTSLAPEDRGWLMFAPATAEPHVIDRAKAWFHIAWKHATDN